MAQVGYQITSKIELCTSKFFNLFPTFYQDTTNPLSKEEKKKWQAQSQKNVLVKKTMEAIGWEYVSLTLNNVHINKNLFLSNLQFICCFIFPKDPLSPLSREEQQKKVWQAQSNKNVLVKKTMDAIFPYVSQHFNNF